MCVADVTPKMSKKYVHYLPESESESESESASQSKGENEKIKLHLCVPTEEAMSFYPSSPPITEPNGRSLYPWDASIMRVHLCVS